MGTSILHRHFDILRTDSRAWTVYSTVLDGDVEMMSSRAPLQRLSVEERVDHAVQGAVRRALDEQRRAQERELDTLSDALQR